MTLPRPKSVDQVMNCNRTLHIHESNGDRDAYPTSLTPTNGVSPSKQNSIIDIMLKVTSLYTLFTRPRRGKLVARKQMQSSTSIPC